MTTKTLTTADFNGTQVPVIAHHGDAWMDSETVGAALGYANPRRSINKVFNDNKDELEAFSCVTDLVTHDHDGREVKRQVRLYNEEGVMMLCFFSKQPVAKDFRCWAVGVLKQYRHGGLERRDNADEVTISRAQFVALSHAAEKMVLLEELRQAQKPNLVRSDRVAQLANWAIELLEREAIARGQSFPGYCAYVLAEHAGELNRRRVN
jgi:prophage antirepressor-like protein